MSNQQNLDYHRPNKSKTNDSYVAQRISRGLNLIKIVSLSVCWKRKKLVSGKYLVQVFYKIGQLASHVSMSGPFSSIFKEVIFNSQLQFFLFYLFFCQAATQHTAHLKILNLEVDVSYTFTIYKERTSKRGKQLKTLS